MLIVDDCSTDNTPNIIHRYTQYDPRIKYLKTQKASGSPSVPRNIGIDNSIGEYVAFLDSDDLWLPYKLEKQVEFMKMKDIQISYSFYEKISWRGQRDSRIISTSMESSYKSLLKSNTIPCLTSMVSHKVIGNTRFKQIPQEDFCFWLDILKKGYIAYNMGELTALYRLAKDSRSSNKMSMFKGYWNVIRNHQGIGLIPSCFYMLTYTYKGILKYLK